MSRLALAITVAFACSIVAQQADALKLFRGNKPRPNRHVEYPRSAAPPARTRTNKKLTPFRFAHSRAGTLKAVGGFLGALTGTAALGYFAVHIVKSPAVSNWFLMGLVPAARVAKDQMVETYHGVVNALRTANDIREAAIETRKAGPSPLELKNPGGFGVDLSWQQNEALRAFQRGKGILPAPASR